LLEDPDFSSPTHRYLPRRGIYRSLNGNSLLTRLVIFLRYAITLFALKINLQHSDVPLNLLQPIRLQREYTTLENVQDIPLADYDDRVVDIDFLDVKLRLTSFETFFGCPFYNTNDPYMAKVFLPSLFH
jgi:hypothetical protein